MREQLQEENRWLRETKQERETQLATMENLSMEALQCRKPSRSYAFFLKEKWMKFQIKTLVQHVSMPFQDYT